MIIINNAKRNQSYYQNKIDPYTRDNDESETTPANSIIIRTKEDMI